LLNYVFVQDLAGCLSIIVENIFGFGVADSSSGNWHIGRVVKSQSGDFSNLRYLLSPNGPLLQVIYQLSTDPACRYEFPISCLPVSMEAQFISVKMYLQLTGGFVCLNIVFVYLMRLLEWLSIQVVKGDNFLNTLVLNFSGCSIFML
jgi:hypothetical protein